MTLPDILKQYRKLNKYSQEKLAELLGVSRQAVTKWENGKSAPSTENLIKLVAIYKISLDDLINDRPEVTEVDSNPKRKSRLEWIVGMWSIILIVLLVISIFSFSKGVDGIFVWSLFNLALLIIIIVTLIYFLALSAKMLNKYIQS